MLRHRTLDRIPQLARRAANASLDAKGVGPRLPSIRPTDGDTPVAGVGKDGKACSSRRASDRGGSVPGLVSSPRYVGDAPSRLRRDQGVAPESGVERAAGADSPGSDRDRARPKQQSPEIERSSGTSAPVPTAPVEVGRLPERRAFETRSPRHAGLTQRVTGRFPAVAELAGLAAGGVLTLAFAFGWTEVWIGWLVDLALRVFGPQS